MRVAGALSKYATVAAILVLIVAWPRAGLAAVQSCPPHTCASPKIVDFENLAVGASVEDPGVAHPDLKITSVPWTLGPPGMPGTSCPGPARVIQVNNDYPWASYSSSSGIDNGCLTGSQGFGDSSDCVLNYDFTFLHNVTVSSFSLRVLDYGDYFPYHGNSHTVTLTAYNASNQPLCSDVLTVLGGETSAGDACAGPDSKGNYVLSVSGSGITKVSLTYDQYPDPNVGYDDISFCEETAAPCPDSMVVYYKFDDPGNRGKDSSPNHLDGTLGAAIPIIGKCGTALRFLPDNEVQDFSTTSNSLLDITDAMSGSAWIRIRGTEAIDFDPSCTEGTIFSKGGNYWFQVERNNDRLVFQNEGSGTETAIGFYNFPINQWVQVGFVRGPWTGSGQTIQFFVNCDTIRTEVYENGVATGSNVLHLAAAGNSLPFMVGNYGFGGNPSDCEFNGDIDEVKVFDRQLSYPQMVAICGCPCDTLPPCPPVDSLVVNTGWDQATSSLLGVGTPDNEWILIGDPDPGTIEPRPATVVAPYVGVGSWTAPDLNSNWISTYPSQHPATGFYTFQYSFCLQDTLAASLSLCVREAAFGAVYLNGNLIGNANPFPSTYAPGSSCASMSTSTGFLLHNTLTAVVDCTGEPSETEGVGLDIVGSIHGHVPQGTACCSDTTGSLLGRVWNDQNADAVIGTSEPGLSSWIVHVTGPKTFSVLTDQLGHYCFMGLPAGTYTISQTPQAGWASSEPSINGPGTYTVILDNGEARDGLNFGRYQTSAVEPGRVPTAFAITQIRPDPTNGACTVSFTLPTNGDVVAHVYDISGRVMADLSPGMVAAGSHEIRWDGRLAGGGAARPGIYLIKLRSGGLVTTARVIVVR